MHLREQMKLVSGCQRGHRIQEGKKLQQEDTNLWRMMIPSQGPKVESGEDSCQGWLRNLKQWTFVKIIWQRILFWCSYSASLDDVITVPSEITSIARSWKCFLYKRKLMNCVKWSVILQSYPFDQNSIYYGAFNSFWSHTTFWFFSNLKQIDKSRLLIFLLSQFTNLIETIAFSQPFCLL